MKPREDVHEVINMRNNDIQVEYPPVDVNYAGEKSQMFPGDPTLLEVEEMQRRNGPYP